MTIIDDVCIDSLLKAFEKFERFRLHHHSEQEKASTIQAFEYCFELSWKMMKKLLEKRERIADSPRETFPMAALENFIDNPENWFDFLQKRNLAVYTYNEGYADKVIGMCSSFSKDIKNFLMSIGVSYDIH